MNVPVNRGLLGLAGALLASLVLGPPAGAQSAAGGAHVEDLDAAALFARGRRLLESGDADGAARVFEILVARGVEHPAVRSILGAAYSHLGRFDEAVDQQRRALDLSGGNPAVRHNLAIALTKAGHLPDAAAEAERVLEARPDHRPALLLLADCRLRLGQSSEVVELVEPIAGEAVQDEAVAYLLGMALLREGELDRAQRVIDGILRKETPQAHLLLATMSVAGGDCPRALEELAKAESLGDPLPTEGFLRGQCLMEENDWDGAARAFRAELDLDPNHFEAQLLYGNLLRESNRNAEALVHLERAARMRPDSVSVSYGLGCALAALGRDAESLAHLERAVREAPGHMQAHVQLAAVYHRLGRAGDAARERDAVKRLVAEQQARAAEGVRSAVSRMAGAEASPAAEASDDP